ncbi:cell division protein FtsL [Porticoccus sp. W117]|uniref:cell division protein FtsL n=1 Tax=Porticoccus sp. W117 TaxID=3054777 RepID=UPI002597E237|nr:cell division protein FtsL [Porticoccus sp. W117]MDM3871747.1 cell division protein FtsL [Porticoccus sp. W117]
MSRSANTKSLPWVTAVLWLAVVVSALAVVNVSHSCRSLFAELSQLEKSHHEQQVVWGQLLLEQAAHGSFSSVEQQAADKLGMRAPIADDIVVVRP